MTDSQTLFNVVFTASMVMLGWILNSLRDSIKALHTADAALSQKVQSIEVLVAGAYVKKDEMQTLADALFAKLDKIDSKLDNKADRSEVNAMHRDGAGR